MQSPHMVQSRREGPPGARGWRPIEHAAPQELPFRHVHVSLRHSTRSPKCSFEAGRAAAPRSRDWGQT